ncbi:MAG: YeeE/YedE family protein [Candidatus Latescibacteria bacterium]|nr:YeeE/YedE family protein [Candidatus Latescibacterota bacterium]
MDFAGLAVGIAFGACLFLGGLANPDKIVGALRLKDFHAIRVIAVFVLVGMLGTWLLHLGDAAHYSLKPAAMLSVLLGGAILGIGFGLVGYCPGTGLACAAAGRMDALVTVFGMFAGALAFILLHPLVAAPLDEIANQGKRALPELTGIPYAAWVIVFTVGGAVVLYLTRPREAA